MVRKPHQRRLFLALTRPHTKFHLPPDPFKYPAHARALHANPLTFLAMQVLGTLIVSQYLGFAP
jgi:hypothetical protein